MEEEESRAAAMASDKAEVEKELRQREKEVSSAEAMLERRGAGFRTVLVTLGASAPGVTHEMQSALLSPEAEAEFTDALRKLGQAIKATASAEYTRARNEMEAALSAAQATHQAAVNALKAEVTAAEGNWQRSERARMKAEEDAKTVASRLERSEKEFADVSAQNRQRSATIAAKEGERDLALSVLKNKHESELRRLLSESAATKTRMAEEVG